MVVRAAVDSGRQRTVVRFALCWRQWLRSPCPTRRWFGPSACGVRPHSFHVRGFGLRKVRALVLLVLACLAVAGEALSDSWPAAAVLGKASANGQYVVRVNPGKSMGDVSGYAGLPKGPYATAQWHRFDGKSYVKVADQTLTNPIAPVDIEVTNRGLLVTLDNWHNLGIGYAVAIYGSHGDLVKKYTLKDLYSASDLKRIQVTTSSVHWRCEGLSSFLESETELWVEDSLGGRFVFNLETGAFEYQRDGGTCQKRP